MKWLVRLLFSKSSNLFLNVNFFADSEKFHEMEKAAETPPKTCFLLDDDGEFPPVAFAAS